MPDEMLFTPTEIERFKALQNALKNDPVSQTQTTGNLHGLNPAQTIGLFGAPGVNPRMYSTILKANGSFLRALPMRVNQYLRERVELLTGITAAQGTNPTTTCGDGMRPGELKVCMQDYEFGQVIANTNTVAGPDQGLYFTRADVDREIVPTAQDYGPFAPDVLSQANNPNSQTYKQMLTLAHGLTLAHEKVLIQGNRSAGATGAGSFDFFVKQSDGLDRQIKTGYVDVPTGVACAGADSRVVNFNTNIASTSATFGSIVDVVSDTYEGLMADVGDTMGYGIENSTWALVMHPRMFRSLTRQWPCGYYTMGCDLVVNNNGERYNINAENARQLQEDMYNGRFLWINGQRVPVLFSWGIANPNVSPDVYISTIYVVPLTLAGEQMAYIDYFNMGNEQQESWYHAMGTNDETRVSNGGLYRMERRQKAGCLEYQFWSRWRFVLRAPFAAARIDGVIYADRIRARSPYIGESFYANGGQTSRGAGQLYSV